MLLIRSKGGFVAECLLPSLIPCVIIKASSNDAATHGVIAPPKRGHSPIPQCNPFIWSSVKPLLESKPVWVLWK